MPRAGYDLTCLFAFRRVAGGADVLLLQRAAGQYMAGTWQPVYGGIKAGETAWQAALRELREETGLIPARLYAIDTVMSFYLSDNDTVYHCPVFAAEVAADAEAQLNHEHDGHAWLAPAEATGRLIWPGQRQALREIVEEIVEAGPASRYLQLPL